jgi:hypothetical protein
VENLAVANDVVLHEASHLMEQHRFAPAFERFTLDPRVGRLPAGPTASGWDGAFLLRESVTAALFPGGCLSGLFGAPVIDHLQKAAAERAGGDSSRARLYQLTGLAEPLVRSYVESGRAIDEDLFEQALAVFEANLHTLD